MSVSSTAASSPDEFRFLQISSPAGNFGQPVAINGNDEIIGSGSFIYNAGIFTKVSIPGVSVINPIDMNDRSTIVCYTVNPFHDFIYNNGAADFIYLPGPGYPVAINNADEVAGYYTDANGNDHGYVYNNGAFTALDVPNTLGTRPTAINNNGDVVGTYVDSSHQIQAFLYKDSQFQTLTRTAAIIEPRAINDSGEIAGVFFDYVGPTTPSTTSHGFLYNQGTFSTIDVPGAQNIDVVGIDANGDVAGFYPVTSGTHSFLYADGRVSPLNVPESTSDRVTSINANGDIVGSSRANNGLWQGFVGEISPSDPLMQLSILDTTTGQTLMSTARLYSGPVAGVQNEYVRIASDNLTITASSDNWFIHADGAMNAITVHGGTNVLDGGAGSNFLTGGAGVDQFYLDDRTPTAISWSTVADFHSGDGATVWGVTPQDFTLTWLDKQGAPGYTGLTAVFQKDGVPEAGITLAGFTSADLNDGKLAVSWGATQDTAGAAGSPYFHIQAS